MCATDESQTHRIEALEFGAHGVDGDLVARGKNQILDVRNHGAGAGAVAHDRSVHDREDSGMNFFLDQKKID